jgi:hypothetical protein
MSCSVLPSWPPVAGLFGFRCPATVAGLVVAVVVGVAIERVFRGGAPSHVGEKVLEAFKPSLPNTDASSSIVGI